MNQCEPWLCHKHAWSTLVWWTETSSLESWTVVTQVTDTAILIEVVEHSTVGILSDQTLSQAEGLSWWAALGGHFHSLQAIEACLGGTAYSSLMLLLIPIHLAEWKIFGNMLYEKQNKKHTQIKEQKKPPENKAHTMHCDLYPSHQVAFWSISSVLNNSLSVLD